MQQLGGTVFSHAIAVTPSDTVPITFRAVYVGGAGNVALKSAPGATAVTFTAVPVGTILYVGFDQGLIMSTNTTATLLIALA